MPNSQNLSNFEHRSSPLFESSTGTEHETLPNALTTMMKSVTTAKANKNDDTVLVSSKVEDKDKEVLSDDEEWLVVKPAADVGANATTAGKRTIARKREDSKVKDNANSNTKETVDSKPNDALLAHPEKPKVTETVPPGGPLLDWKSLNLEWIQQQGSVDWVKVAVTSANGYYVVKRNLKVLVAVFLWSVLVSRGGGSQLAEPSSPQTKVANTHRVDMTVRLLQAQIQALEAEKLDYGRGLFSRVLHDRDHWRSLAVECDRDLRELSIAHAELDEAVQQTKRLAPVAFVSPASALPPNATDVPRPSPAATPLGRSYNDLVVPPSRREPLGRSPYKALVVSPSRAVIGVIPS
jgi:hypothetical protein